MKNRFGLVFALVAVSFAVCSAVAFAADSAAPNGTKTAPVITQAQRDAMKQYMGEQKPLLDQLKKLNADMDQARKSNDQAKITSLNTDRKALFDQMSALRTKYADKLPQPSTRNPWASNPKLGPLFDKQKGLFDQLKAVDAKMKTARDNKDDAAIKQGDSDRKAIMSQIDDLRKQIKAEMPAPAAGQTTGHKQGKTSK